MGVCLCVCMRVCMHVCEYLCLFVHPSVSMSVYSCGSVLGNTTFFHSRVEYLSGLTEQDAFSSLCHHKATDGRDRAQMRERDYIIQRYYFHSSVLSRNILIIVPRRALTYIHMW